MCGKCAYTEVVESDFGRLILHFETTEKPLYIEWFEYGYAGRVKLYVGERYPRLNKTLKKKETEEIPFFFM